jgi:hypothetical protein
MLFYFVLTFVQILKSQQRNIVEMNPHKLYEPLKFVHVQVSY